MSLSITSPGPNTYNADVLQLQNNLLALGFQVYALDGYFGTETQNAVKDFQATWGLTTDGIVGPNTQEAINEAVNLLLTGQWNPSTDPRQYEREYITVGGAGITEPSLTTPSIDWKWIILGIGAAILIFEMMRKK